MSSPVETTKIEICPRRLAHGAWSHKANRMIGEGDIAASYSADRIGCSEPVRMPFTHEGQLWVCVGTDRNSCRAYRLVSIQSFDGAICAYGERVRNGHEGRNDPNGFYHGMRVKHRGEEWVLRGPLVEFIAGTERQGDLFDL